MNRTERLQHEYNALYAEASNTHISAERRAQMRNRLIRIQLELNAREHWAHAFRCVRINRDVTDARKLYQTTPGMDRTLRAYLYKVDELLKRGKRRSLDFTKVTYGCGHERMVKSWPLTRGVRKELGEILCRECRARYEAKNGNVPVNVKTDAMGVQDVPEPIPTVRGMPPEIRLIRETPYAESYFSKVVPKYKAGYRAFPTGFHDGTGPLYAVHVEFPNPELGSKLRALVYMYEYTWSRAVDLAVEREKQEAKLHTV